MPIAAVEEGSIAFILFAIMMIAIFVALLFTISR